MEKPRFLLSNHEMEKLDLNCCRVCLSYSNLQDIFNADKLVKIADKVMFCASVQISENDGLPNKICRQCKLYVDIAFDFKTVCEYTNVHLVQTLNKTNASALRKPINQLVAFDESNNVEDTNSHTTSSTQPIMLLDNCSASEIADTFDRAELLSSSYKKTETEVDIASNTKELDAAIFNESGSVSDFQMKSDRNLVQSDAQPNLINSDFLCGNDVIVDNLFNISINEVCIYSNTDSSFSQVESIENVHNIGDKTIERTKPEKIDDKPTVSGDTSQHICSGHETVESAVHALTGDSEDEIIRDIHTDETDNDEIVRVGTARENSFSHENETFENRLICDMKFERIQIESVDDPDVLNISTEEKVADEFECEKTSDKTKVGRHVAKKNAGQHPRKLQRQHSKELTGPKSAFRTSNVITEKDAQNDVNDVPEALYEENVITDHLELHNNETSLDESKRAGNKNGCLISNKSRSRKIKDKLRFTYKGRNILNEQLQQKRKVKRTKNNKVSENATEKKTKAHSYNKSLTCNICKKSFPFPSHLVRHLNSHTGQKKYKCEYCGKVFANSYNRSEHLRKHTGNFPLKCEVCHKGFSSPSVLKRHMVTHTEELPYQCEYCSKSFRQSSSRQLHERMHFHRPSYKCEICFKVFAYTNSLTAHKKTHSGSESHTCFKCNKSYTRKTSLIRHMSTHTSEVEYKCEFCDHCFADNDSYLVHFRSHSKHQCHVCNMGFSTRNLLVDHLKQHKNSLKCQQCNKGFSNRTLLIKHLKKHIKIIK